MRIYDYIGIKAANLKCFGNEQQGFDAIRPLNLIIGRNNTGKTALLDAVAFAHAPSSDQDLYHRGSEPRVSVSFRIEADLAIACRNTIQGAQHPAHQFAEAFENQTMNYIIDANGSLNCEPPFSASKRLDSQLASNMSRSICAYVKSRLSGNECN